MSAEPPKDAADVALIPALREDIPLIAALSRFYVYDIARAVTPALDTGR